MQENMLKKKITLLATMLTLCVIFSSCSANINTPQPRVSYSEYIKVTSLNEFESGDYLIVNEENQIIFNSKNNVNIALENNFIQYELTENKIKGTNDIDDAAFTISKCDNKFTILCSNGTSFISGPNMDANGVSTSNKPLFLYMSMDQGNVHIVSQYNCVLRLVESNNKPNRFRFDKSTSYLLDEPVQLYKKIDKDPNPPKISSVTIVDSNLENYTTNSVYKTDNELIVSALYTNGKKVTVAKEDDLFSYEIKDSKNQTININYKFPSSGNYTIEGKYQNVSSNKLTFTVKNGAIIDPILKSLNVLMTKKTFKTKDCLYNYKDTITVNLTFDDNTTKTINFDDLEQNGLTLVLSNPKREEADIKANFGILGTWSILVTHTKSGLYFTEYFTVTNEVIRVSSISIRSSITKVEEGKTLQLSATIQPENASEQTLVWESNNEDLATVDENGLVTAHLNGQVIITANATDGSNVKGSIVITITPTTEVIYPTSIYFKEPELSAKKNTKKKLSANYVPANANTELEVTWTSNKPTLASVDNDGNLTISSSASEGQTCTITATLKRNPSKTAQLYITIAKSEDSEWTILLYVSGNDLESSNGLATEDISEILSVRNQPKDVNIVLQTGGAKSWRSKYKIDASKTQRWHTSNNSLILDESSQRTNMGESTTLQSFIEWGLNKYPADKVGLILWNHGGAMRGVCCDENYYDDALLNSEVDKALKNAFSNLNRTEKLEFVGYDACLMQIQDIADFNSQYFNYMIASEESESGTGWDYDGWIDDVYNKKPTTTILKEIADTFIRDNGGTSSSYNDQTMSYLDLSYAVSYKTAFEDYANALTLKLSSVQASKSTFASWMTTNVKKFADDYYSSYEAYGLFDVKDMINKLSNESKYNPGDVKTTNLLTEFDKFVAYSTKGKGAGQSFGLGLFYACSSYYSSSYRSMYSSKETSYSAWSSFNKAFGYL